MEMCMDSSGLKIRAWLWKSLSAPTWAKSLDITIGCVSHGNLQGHLTRPADQAQFLKWFQRGRHFNELICFGPISLLHRSNYRTHLCTRNRDITFCSSVNPEDCGTIFESEEVKCFFEFECDVTDEQSEVGLFGCFYVLDHDISTVLPQVSDKGTDVQYVRSNLRRITSYRRNGTLMKLEDPQYWY